VELSGKHPNRISPKAKLETILSSQISSPEILSEIVNLEDEIVPGDLNVITNKL